MPDDADYAAIVIMAEKFKQIEEVYSRYRLDQGWGMTWLAHAIKHLAYPDRDVYPKSCKGTKGRYAPCQHAGTTMSLGCDGTECPEGTLGKGVVRNTN